LGEIGGEVGWMGEKGGEEGFEPETVPGSETSLYKGRARGSISMAGKQ
jgi:hypothetical protein